MDYKNVYDDRSHWIRYRLFWLPIIALLAIASLIGISYLSYIEYVSYQYKHAATNQPNMPNEQLQQWAAKVALQSYSYSYKDVDIHIAELKPYFTPSGWDAFNKALAESHNIDVIKSNKYTLSPKLITNQIKILSQQFDKELNSYAWKLLIPATITYKNKEQEFQQMVDITMVIMRIAKKPENDGIAINTFIVLQK